MSTPNCRMGTADWKAIAFSWPAAISWGLTLAACWSINAVWGLEIFFLGLPGWFIATGIYITLCYTQQNAHARAKAEQHAGDRT